MQFLTTTLLAFATAVAANNYTLRCGSSCSTGVAVSTGADYSGQSCTNLDNSEPYCYLEADVSQYKAIVSSSAGCLGGDSEQVIWPGECFEGPWESFQVAVNL